MSQKAQRRAYFISDRTGITSESLGEALLNQFDNIDFKRRTYPFIDTPEKARTLITHIQEEVEQDGIERALIFSSIVDSEVRALIRTCPAFHIDFYDTFIDALEAELHTEARRVVGMTHGLHDTERYDKRMEAVNFTLNHDDGISDKELKKADVILVGVSRSGKTPTCLYLALQYGIRAANYPLTPEDLESTDLPRMLKPYRDKLFGLTIDCERLQQIRSERRPDSSYASASTCNREVSVAEEIFHRHRIPFLSSTHKSVEELSASILQASGLKRRF
ncbi:MAG: pyruvate, water dikinase regulatory protein [Neisseria sp.]|nr:pyruvate, water dikinase regulatory protein [Neisseria sp.]